MLPKEVMIVGVARNCSGKIRKTVEIVNAAFAFTNKLHWLIIESDSEDNTVSELSKLAAEFVSFNFVTLGPLRSVLASRTQRLAHCRNRYIELLNSDYRLLPFSHVVVVDLDGVNFQLTRGGVESCFRQGGWTAVFANQAGPYYDIWALRHDEWCPGDCWEEYNLLIGSGIHPDLARWHSVYRRMITIPTDTQWIPVRSAFGGIGIYERDQFLSCRYIGSDNGKSEVCEHVALHRQLCELGCSLFINPGFVNDDVNEHSRPGIAASQYFSSLRRWKSSNSQ